MFEIIGGLLGKVLGSSTKEGESQLLSLFEGKAQKIREFDIEMEKLLQDRINLELEDLRSARDMQIEALKQNDIFSKRFVYYVSGFLLLAAVVANFIPFFVNIPQEMMTMVNRSTDFLNYVSAGSVISFYFGAKTTKQNGGKG